MTTAKQRTANNEINININVSDDLLNKFMGAMIKMSSMSSMGGLQMMLGSMMGTPEEEPKKKEQKETIGFHATKGE